MHIVKSLIFILCFSLLGCEQNPKVNAQAGTPEYIAGEFFHAIYNEKDLSKAKGMCTSEFASLLASYGTARQAGRILFNMNFDTVIINVNRSGRNLREQYHNDASIQLIFDGEFDGQRVQETRTILLVKQRGSWRVKEVLPDKFSSSIR